MRHRYHTDPKKNTRGHADDFLRAFGVEGKMIPAFLYRVVRYGAVIRQTSMSFGGVNRLENVYYYQGKNYVLAAVGANGFLVSAYPISKLRKGNNDNG